MKNPIKDNRVVDKTFATRLLRFAESISVADACGSDEKDSMISYATRLLRYQIETVSDKEEKDYLNRVGVYDKYKAKRITTEDGVEVIENDGVTLYSILKRIQKGDQVLHIRFTDIRHLKDTRLYFFNVESCKHHFRSRESAFEAALNNNLLDEAVESKKKLRQFLLSLHRSNWIDFGDHVDRSSLKGFNEWFEIQYKSIGFW